MKKLVFIVFALFVGVSYADNVITSKSYVDTAANNLQEQIGANDANTVLTYTDTAGRVSEKAIYDSSESFDEQTDALVTAGAFNTAVQNALESEFVCIDWLGDVHDNNHCLLYQIRATQPTQVLPNGYTRVEYLTSDGTSWFNTNIPWTSVVRFRGKAKLTRILNALNRAVLGSSEPSGTVGLYGIQYTTATGATFWYFNTNIHPTTTAKFDFHKTATHKWAGTVNNEQSVGGTAFEGNVLLFTTLQTGYENDYNRRGWNGSVWYIQLFDSNDTLLFNGIPARRNSDNAIGMYDTVTNTFFTSAGAQAFTAGPDIGSNIYFQPDD